MHEPDRQAAQDISGLGEAGVLRGIFPTLSQDQDVLVGPGDDSAVVRLDDPHLVVSTDMMVEGRDFVQRLSGAADIGHKAAIQNLADVVAMGAVPRALVVSLGAPATTSMEWIREFSSSLSAVSRRHGAGVVGGDLSGAGEIVISVTAMGHMGGMAPALRSGAEAGDVLAVAGCPLGGSGAGLDLLFAGAEEAFPGLASQHRRPDPDLAAGRRALEHGVHAMIDISDGLVRDARRIAESSGVAIDIDRRLLEQDCAALEPAGREVGKDALEWVLFGGEEHCMLAAFHPERPLPPGFRPLGRIGTADGPGTLTLDGAEIAGQGWDHFTS